MRLLVAEQDPIARSLITSALAPKFEVISVADGAKAAGAITDAHEYGEPFDVVVLNMELSCQANSELIKLLRSLEEPRAAVGAKSSKVIFLSTPTVPSYTSVDIPRLLEDIQRLTR